MNEHTAEVDLFWLNFFSILMIVSVTINIAIFVWAGLYYARVRRLRKVTQKKK